MTEPLASPPAVKPAPLAEVTAESILDRYLSNEPTAEIAKSLGVTHQALSKHMLKHAMGDWQQAQVARAMARKERAEQDLEDLRNGSYLNDHGERVLIDAVSIACARERLKSAQWDLERVCRRIYGANVELTGKDGEALMPKEDTVTLARKVAFLLRKGVEEANITDAQVIDQPKDAA